MSDFTGFYFNNKHSSTYHLVRTSSGDRYKDKLFPAFEDRTIELVGGHGNAYSNTRYKEKEFSIPVAFDNISEEDFRSISSWLEPNKIGEFRFDEKPYKAYRAKLKSPPEFEYLCFMRQKENSFTGDMERVYKGEATLDFIAYDPFGYCCDNTYLITKEGVKFNQEGINWQSLDAYRPFNVDCDNITEWAETSKLRSSAFLNNCNIFKQTESNTAPYTYIAKLYNPGDFDADFELFIDLGGISKETLAGKTVYIKVRKEDDINDPASQQFVFSTTGLGDTLDKDGKVIENKILINTKNHSLQVLDFKEEQFLQSSMRYDLFVSGIWQKIPKGERVMVIQSAFPLNGEKVIKYNYKYY